MHLKTAGTNWLEELIGLAEAGGEGLKMVQQIYAYAFAHVAEFCAPYATVIDIQRDQLPSPDELNKWSGIDLAAAIRHVPNDPRFNAHLRQLLHVSFKVAALQGERYLQLLRENAEVVGRNVTENIYARHLLPLFIG